MGRVSAFVVLFRVLLETASFLNFKYVCRSFSAPNALLVYMTNSLCSIFFLIDLARYNTGLLGTVEKRTSIKKKRFLISTFFLAVLLNLISFSRTLMLQSLSEVAIAVLPCTNLVFTKVFFDRKRAFSLRKRFLTIIIVIGVMVTIMSEKKYLGCLIALITSFMSSLYDFVYKKMTEATPSLQNRIAALKKQKETEIRGLERRKRIETYLRSPLHNARRTWAHDRDFGFCIPQDKPGVETVVIEQVPDHSKAEMVRNMHIAYYYMVFTGMVTALFCWPFLLLKSCGSLRPLCLPLVFSSVIFSTLLSFQYFITIGVVSTLLAQLSGLFFRVLIVGLDAIQHGARIQHLGAFVVFIALLYI